MDRRDQLADAALTVLARSGMRGLTHRAVDREAEIAEGSTSYYFRTRAALLQGCVERMAALTLDEVGDPSDPSGPNDPSGPTDDPAAALEQLGERVFAAVHGWATHDRDRLLARHELLLESARRPELRKVLAEAADRVITVVETQVAGLGLADSHARIVDLVGCIDGLALSKAVAGEPIDAAALRRRVDGLVRGLFSGD
ncbi:TetR/AcrR family transcriptional regulator [Pseudonocardia sp. TRM90224]|uniref:TetR/AcrR family transcriptional regulator n=1 Tax=Pseudonocardia sp. TRM90224 TaxID=2812678 RepID=UPI001E6157A5|nr:TetR family transcriptional regulator [Pseudonocardia sp. TRM90224]